jgi:hypothetical protein
VIKNTIFRTKGGRQFFGQMLHTPTTAGNDANFIHPRRVLKVGKRCLLQAGEVINTGDGTFLVLEHSEAKDYRLHKLVQLDRKSAVTRSVVLKDPLTGLDKKSTDTLVGTIDCVFEFLGQTDDLQVAVDGYRVVTDFPLQLNDKLDGRYTVRNVERMLGAYVATVR